MGGGWLQGWRAWRAVCLPQAGITSRHSEAEAAPPIVPDLSHPHPPSTRPASAHLESELAAQRHHAALLLAAARRRRRCRRSLAGCRLAGGLGCSRPGRRLAHDPRLGLLGGGRRGGSGGGRGSAALLEPLGRRLRVAELMQPQEERLVSGEQRTLPACRRQPAPGIYTTSHQPTHPSTHSVLASAAAAAAAVQPVCLRLRPPRQLLLPRRAAEAAAPAAGLGRLRARQRSCGGGRRRFGRRCRCRCRCRLTLRQKRLDLAEGGRGSGWLANS